MNPGWFGEADAREKVRLADGASFYWKYVRVGGGYRFADATRMTAPEHKSALEGGEAAEGAAFAKVSTWDAARAGDEVEVRVEGWSATLKIGPAGDDEDRLLLLLGGAGGA
jgi:hypothetical protein